MKRNRGDVMTAVVWVAVVLMLGGAALLVAGVSASGLWIAVITVGIALTVFEWTRGRSGARHA
jgi:hypothetical protein